MVENDYLMVTIRDINLICQHFKTYALIEGEKRRRKITKARRRKGVLEVRIGHHAESCVETSSKQASKDTKPIASSPPD